MLKILLSFLICSSDATDVIKQNEKNRNCVSIQKNIFRDVIAHCSNNIHNKYDAYKFIELISTGKGTAGDYSFNGVGPLGTYEEHDKAFKLLQDIGYRFGSGFYIPYGDNYDFVRTALNYGALNKWFEENNDGISQKKNNNFTEDLVDISKKREDAINKWKLIVGEIETTDSRDSNELAIEFLESDDSEFLTREDLIRCFDSASKIVKCCKLDVFKGYEELIVKLINHPLCVLDQNRILHVWNHSILKEFWNQRLNNPDIAFNIIRNEKYFKFLSNEDIKNAWGNATTKVSPFGPSYDNEVYLYSDWLAARIFENEKSRSVLEEEGLINEKIIKDLCNTVKNSFEFSSNFSAFLPAAILRSEKYQELITRDHVLEMWDKCTSRPERNYYGLDYIAIGLLNTPYSRNFLGEDKILSAWNNIVHHDEESGKIEEIKSDYLCSIFLKDADCKNYLIKKGILDTTVVELFNSALSFDSCGKKIKAPLVVAVIVEDNDYRNVLKTNVPNVNDLISFLNNLRENYSKESNCRKDRSFFYLINIVDRYFVNDD